MPKFQVTKSIEINASTEQVYQALNDFHHWPKWSPWLIAEPEAKVTIREDGKYYEWLGNRVGSGNMTVLEENAPLHINFDLTFLKPWKSTAKTYFNLSPQGDKTKVQWTMDSSLPFFLFWMKKSMIAYIGSDYDRGLNMLKEFVEEGNIKSKLEFKGESQHPGCQYIAIQRSTSLDQMPTHMEQDYGRLFSYVHQDEDNVAGTAFSIYHKFDMVKRTTSFSSCIPVKTVPADLPSDFISGTIPATKVYTLRHVGAYKHLGNAWSTLQMMIRNKEMKLVKGIHPFETYVSDPKVVAEESIITDISFAVK